MKKYLLALLLLTSVFAVAAGVDPVQFTRNDFNVYKPSGEWREGTGQFWEPAQIITLNVSAGSTVYLSNYISNWYGTVENLGDDSYAAGYNMSGDKFGYMIAGRDADGKVITDGVFHQGTNDTTQLTYYNADRTASQTTTGYKLGTFDNDTEILFVMTPNGYDKKVDSYYPVNDPVFGYNTILTSRQINTVDQAGNVRVNFGTLDGVGHEFIIGYAGEPPQPPEPPSGQPLPGVLTSCLVALGATGIAARRRKHSRK